jgi:hypothetical protein
LRFKKTPRKLIANSRGFSSIVGAVFAVLVMMSLISTVFVWSLSQNTLYNNTVTQTRQADLDRTNEKIVADVNVSRVTGTTTVWVNGTLKNDGPLPVSIVTLWGVGTNASESTYANSSLSITLKPGYNITTATNVALTKLDGESLSCWFISARGNTISEKSLSPTYNIGTGSTPYALVAGGIGSISMNFSATRSYIVTPIGNPSQATTGTLGSPNVKYTIDHNAITAFSINVTNLDFSQRSISLNMLSSFWVMNPPDSNGGIKGWTWPIATVTDIAGVKTIKQCGSNEWIPLTFNETTIVYFGPFNSNGKVIAPSQGSLGTGAAAVNLLLVGRVETTPSPTDYGQNLPFISLTIT